MLLQNTWAMRASGVAPPVVMSYSSTDTAGSNSSTLTITKPSGVQPGDLLLAVMCGSGPGGGESWTGDTGWTEVVDQGVWPILRVAWKIAGASEPASYSFTCSNSRRLGGGILRIARGAFDTIGAIGTSSTTAAVVAPAITSAGGLLVGFFGNDNKDISFTTPTGMIAQFSDSDGNEPSFACFSERIAAGSTGTRSSTPSDTANHAGALISIKSV